jgi:hypothetical protein
LKLKFTIAELILLKVLGVFSRKERRHRERGERKREKERERERERERETERQGERSKLYNL